MYLVVIAWLYIAFMMAFAEAIHSNGSIIGAIVTFFLYGIGPMALVVYLMNTPARRKKRRQQEALELAKTPTSGAGIDPSVNPAPPAEPPP